MKEIVTVQVGGFANFVGSHFWNFQVFFTHQTLFLLKNKLYIFFWWFSTFCIQQIYWFVYKNCSHWKEKKLTFAEISVQNMNLIKANRKKKEYHFQNITLFLFDFEYVTFENQLQISHLHEFLIMSMNYGMTIYWFSYITWVCEV